MEKNKNKRHAVQRCQKIEWHRIFAFLPYSASSTVMKRLRVNVINFANDLKFTVRFVFKCKYFRYVGTFLLHNLTTWNAIRLWRISEAHHIHHLTYTRHIYLMYNTFEAREMTTEGTREKKKEFVCMCELLKSTVRTAKYTTHNNLVWRMLSHLRDTCHIYQCVQSSLTLHILIMFISSQLKSSYVPDFRSNS